MKPTIKKYNDWIAESIPGEAAPMDPEAFVREFYDKMKAKGLEFTCSSSPIQLKRGNLEISVIGKTFINTKSDQLGVEKLLVRHASRDAHNSYVEIKQNGLSDKMMVYGTRGGVRVKGGSSDAYSFSVSSSGVDAVVDWIAKRTFKSFLESISATLRYETTSVPKWLRGYEMTPETLEAVKNSMNSDQFQQLPLDDKISMNAYAPILVFGVMLKKFGVKSEVKVNTTSKVNPQNSTDWSDQSRNFCLVRITRITNLARSW